MKLYDAHCHLNEEHVFPRWKECFQRFLDVGGAGIVNVGANESFNEKGIEIARKSLCKATVGLHPEIVGTEITQENMKEKIQNLKTMIEENREHVVAVGECGVDFHVPGSEDTRLLQRELFVAQCELARELDLPLVIHSRDAFDQTLDVLKEYRNLVVYFHCRGYGPNEVERLKIESPLKRINQKSNWKLYIGFCGNVTYKKADNLRESLKLVPLDSLLLETDAPWLTPQVVRGQENEPANVKLIYEFVAEYLGMDMEKLAQYCEQNFKNLYGV